MKNRYIIRLALFLIIILASCDQDLLDIKQKSALPLEDYYANAGPKEAEALIASVYNRLFNNVYGIATQLFVDILSDDHFAGGASFSDLANNFQEASNMIATSQTANFRTMYNSCYEAIYWCNLILEKIPASDNATIKRVKAEADFIRALCMFELVRWFGTPPFVDHVLAKDEYTMGNGDPEVIIPWCLEHMQAAADALPALSGIGQQKTYGARISKHAALAYKGKVALWYGTRYNKPAILSQAVEPLKTVVNSNLYGLVDDMFIIDRKAGDFCKEYVFEHNSADANGYSSYQADLRQTWMNLRPENMAIPDNVFNLGWGWCAVTADFGEFLEAHEGGIEKPRFKSTIHTYEQILAMSYNNSALPPGIFTGIAHCQGYFRYRNILFRDDLYKDITGWWQYSAANCHYMRYSEVLLMYAEAKFLVDGDADGTGRAALNQVRVRAQLDPLTTMTYQDIKDERRAEMWSEHERFFDLVRWGDAAEALKDKGKTWYTFWGYKPGTTEWDVRTQKGSGNGYNSKYVLFPFPYEQLSANPNLDQNKDW
ncbi:MAG: RagB/SusD family nutrient uptake outer membrane protein [Bacteroidales bacterium]|nr:RagB/SusD family nutrient uptake outer membrane protein [Bacteroidales bacterium]OQB65630.1 MAG: SusD family protein [Bacteroidetes bacterium ADurb.Bin145]HOU02665.1 RagB/SusD family nutrient uptake outer membrane protein [Bacteroidales bacterium]HQK67459.1 RagB/SusD family nutrient uptake outer membrane protein [Bacteroidales bacterium]